LISSPLRSKTTAWQASVMENFFYVYILVSEADATQHYTGITRDLPSRLKEHNQGTCIYTARCRPWRIETAIAFRSKAKARAFEKYLKTGSGREFSHDIYKLPPSVRVSRRVKRYSVMGQAEFLRGSHTHSPKFEIRRFKSAISQNRHTTATESSREAFNLLSWTSTLCILRFFQSQWFLKKFAPREKCSRPRRMRPLAWESSFAR